MTLGDQGAVQHDVHLADPERQVVLRMESADLILEDLIAPRPWWGWADLAVQAVDGAILTQELVSMTQIGSGPNWSFLDFT